MRTIEQILEAYSPISLDEMDRVKLMNRTETKFVFATAQLPEILEGLLEDYRILEVKGARKSGYNTLYFDTAELKFYNQHHNGKLNRQKVRIRTYVNTNQSYVEIKTKNNKGRTIKKRIKDKEPSTTLSDKAIKFIGEQVNIDVKDISAQLWNSYSRITLVHLKSEERVTIDLDLQFDIDGKKAQVKEIIIAEVKQEKYNVRSPFIQKMRSLHIKPMRMSKYCIGTVLLKSNVKSNSFKEGMKYNRFKEKVLIIDKIKDGGT